MRNRVDGIKETVTSKHASSNRESHFRHILGKRCYLSLFSVKIVLLFVSVVARRRSFSLVLFSDLISYMFLFGLRELFSMCAYVFII